MQLSARSVGPTGGDSSEASATGALDSLPALVDRVAAQLLAGQDRGTAPCWASSRLHGSIAEYLQGKSAHRRGRYREAVAHFNAALREDSTFALAALDLIASAIRTSDAGSVRRARALAWTSRAKLSPEGGRRCFAPGRVQIIRRPRRWFSSSPPGRTRCGSPPTWWMPGSSWATRSFTSVPSSTCLARSRAPNENFRRSLELDSSFVMPLDHLLLAKLYLEDTTGLRALARLWAAQDTASGDRSDYMRWRLAVALGDSATVSLQRARLDRWPDQSLIWLTGVSRPKASAWETRSSGCGRSGGGP